MTRKTSDPRLLDAFDQNALSTEDAERLAQAEIDSDAALASPTEETLPAEFYAAIAESEEVNAEFLDEPPLKRAQQELLESPEPLDASWLERTLADDRFSAAPSGEWIVPTRIDAYEIEKRLGRGAMGTVFRARHVNLKNAVALKILSPEHTGSRRAVELFYREMESLGRLRHPNVVQALHAGEAGGLHFLAMELVDGIDAGKLSTVQGDLRICDACEIIRQAAHGLEAAHDRHLVHRDIKPSNLMVTRGGRVKLLDLGLARVRLSEIQSATTAAESGDAVPAGTADYMAPEQWETPAAVDIRTDLYSLGCTLFKLLTGRTPFLDASTLRRKMQAHATEPPPPVRSLRPDVPEGLALVIDRLLAKRPSERFAEPRELLEAIRPYCHGSDLGALLQAVLPPSDVQPLGEATDQPALATGPQRRAPRRRWWAWTAAAIGGLAVLAGIVIHITDKGEIVVTVDQPQATINIDGAKLETGQSGQPTTIRIQSGQYELVVRKSGFEPERQTIRIERGDVQREDVSLARSEQIVRPSAEIDLASGALAALRLTPAGDRAVVGGSEGAIHVVDLESREVTASWQAHAAQAGETLVLDVDPTGTHIVSGGHDGAIVVWNLASGEEVRRLAEEGPAILCVRISPDGKRLITGGFGDAAELWDLETFEHLATLAGHQSWIRDAAFGPENRLAVTCGNDANAIVWDLATGSMQAYLVGHTAPVSSVDLTPDGRFAVTGSWDGTVRIWELSTGASVRTFARHAGPVRQVQFLDGVTVLSASEDNDLRIWNPLDDSVLLVLRGHARRVIDADARSGGRQIVSAGQDGTLRRWEAPPNLMIATSDALARRLAAARRESLGDFVADWKVSDGPVAGLAVFGDLTLLAAVSRAGELSIWEIEGGDARDTLSRRDVEGVAGVTAVSFDGDGNLALGTRDGGVYLLAAGERVPRRIYSHQRWVSDIAFTNDEKAVVSCGFDGTVRLWKLVEEQELSVTAPGGHWLYAVAAIPGSPMTLYGGGTDGSVYAWWAEHDGPPARYGEPFTWHAVSTIAVSADNRLVAAAGWKGEIRLWDNALATFERTLVSKEAGSEGGSPVSDIAFTPAAERLVSAGEDGKLRVWDPSTGRIFREVRAHAGAARAVTVAGEFAFTAGDDGMVRQWRWYD